MSSTVTAHSRRSENNKLSPLEKGQLAALNGSFRGFIWPAVTSSHLKKQQQQQLWAIKDKTITCAIGPQFW